MKRAFFRIDKRYIRHIGLIPGFIPLVPPRIVVAGSQSVTATGNFTVPEYNTLTITLRGAGGEGGNDYISFANGYSGGATTITSLSLTANGGAGGSYNTTGGSGGTASGGDTNTTGSAGGSGTYVGYPSYTATGGQGGGSGGAGGVDNSADAVAVAGSAGASAGQGGGGAAYVWYYSGKGGSGYTGIGGGGGGQGGLCVKTYTRGAAGAPSPGDVLSVTIGAGGTGRTYGGDGYRGQADFSWS